MPRYVHRPLPEGSIRLLRIKPDPDDGAPVECQLFDAPVLESGRVSLYETLSYVWGPQDKPRSILVNGCDFAVGENLYAALKCLRDPLFERLMWIDAICINQNDAAEKGHQVQAMAKIYAKARGVVVWLGPSTAESRRAIRFIQALALQKGKPESNHSAPLPVSETDMLDLFQRQWFRRIWVLQEVAAAQHIVVKSGPDEINGAAFCAGIEKLQGELQAGKHEILDPHGTVQEAALGLDPVIRPMKAAGLRPRIDDYASPGCSINVAPLAELVDMYRGREATDRRDKIYALLGMSSDDPGAAGLVPDYTISWEDLFRRFIDFAFSGKVLASFSDDGETVYIRGKGLILHLDCDHDDDLAERDWSPSQLQLNTIVCWLEGAAAPTLVACHGSCSAVVKIATARHVDCRREPHPDVESMKTIDFLLAWDWRARGRDGGDQESAGRLVALGSKVPASMELAWEAPMRAQIRALNSAMIWCSMWANEWTVCIRKVPEWTLMAVRAAVDEYQSFLGSPQGQTRSETDYEVARLLAQLSLIVRRRSCDNYVTQPAWIAGAISPLLLAASTARAAVVERILSCPDPAVDAKYELSLAAQAKDETAVAVLMATGKSSPWPDGGIKPPPGGSAAQIALANVFGERPGRPADGLDLNASPEGRILRAFLAMDNGTRQVLYAGVKSAGSPLRPADLCLLLEKYPFDLSHQDSEGQTLLLVAAEAGNFEIAEFLLSSAEGRRYHPCRARDCLGRTPLMMAAARGHVEVAELLLASGESMPNSEDKDGLTALMLAAASACEEMDYAKRLRLKRIFITLMDVEGAQLAHRDSHGRTVLMLVAQARWADIVELLLETDAVRAQLNAQDSKGRTALLYSLMAGKQPHSVMQKWHLYILYPQAVLDNMLGVFSVAICLLENDWVDVNVVDDDGNSAISSLRAWPPLPRVSTDYGSGLDDLENDLNRVKLLEHLHTLRSKVWPRSGI